MYNLSHFLFSVHFKFQIMEVLLNIPKTMKALVKKHTKPGLWLEEIETPQLGVNDVLIKDVKLGKLKVGDIISFLKIGAYNISWQNQFCFPRPPIVMFEGKRIKMIRRRETYSDMLNRDEY